MAQSADHLDTRLCLTSGAPTAVYPKAGGAEGPKEGAGTPLWQGW